MSLNVGLLQQSFMSIMPQREKFTEAFYRELFLAYPEVKPLFHRNSTQQRGMLFASLAIIVRDLNNPEKLRPTLAALGERHKGYHVKPEYYAGFVDVMLKTLASFLGEQWTPELAVAWVEGCNMIVAMMSGNLQAV